MGVASVRPKGIRLRTSYRSEDQFVAAFHALVDEGSLFVPTDKLLPASTQCYFSVELADESPMLRGLGVVIDSWSGSANPFKRSGVHVRVTQLTAQTEPIFERLIAAQPVAKNVPRTRKAPMTQQQWGNVVEPTAEMVSAFPVDDDEPTASASANADAEETVPAKPITREMVSASIPPVNKPIARAEMSAAPIAEMDEKTTETQRYNNQLRMPAKHVEPAAAQMKSLPGMAAAPGSSKQRSTRSGSPAVGADAQLDPAAQAKSDPTPVPASRSSATALPPPPAFPRASAAALPPPGTFARGSSPPATNAATAAAVMPSATNAAIANVDNEDTTQGAASIADDAITTQGAASMSDSVPAYPATPPLLADMVASARHESVHWGEPDQPKWRVVVDRVRATGSHVRARLARVPWLRLVWWRAGVWREAWWANRKTGGMLAAGIVVGVVFTLLLRPARTIEVATPVAMPAPERQAVAACEPAPAPTAVADATPAASAAKSTKAKPAPTARPQTKPAAAPAKAVALATPLAPKPAPAAAASKPAPAAVAAAPKPAPAAAPKPAPAAVAVAKPAPAVAKPAPAPTKPAVAVSKPAPAPSKPAVASTAKPTAAPPATKTTNVASNKPSSRSPCKASVPCI